MYAIARTLWRVGERGADVQRMNLFAAHGARDLWCWPARGKIAGCGLAGHGEFDRFVYWIDFISISEKDERRGQQWHRWLMHKSIVGRTTDVGASIWSMSWTANGLETWNIISTSLRLRLFADRDSTFWVLVPRKPRFGPFVEQISRKRTILGYQIR